MLKSRLFFPVLEDRDGERHGHVKNCSRCCGAPAARQREAHEAKEMLAAAAQSLHEMLREKRARRSHAKARRKSAASRAAPENLTLKQHCDLM